MATASFRPCPSCGVALSYLEGTAASTKTPRCPRCHKLVEVQVATFLMLDTSGRGSTVKIEPKK
jgi:hypothetical protein